MTRRTSRRTVELPCLPDPDRAVAAQWRRLQRQRRDHRIERLARVGAVMGFTLATVGVLVGITQLRRQPGAMPAQHRLSSAPSPACITGATVAPLLP